MENRSMRNLQFRLFKWKDLVVKADGVFLILFGLLILSLRFRIFPFFYSNLGIASYWGMALIAAQGMALSVIAHEMVHVAVARQLGVRPHGLFLNIFAVGTSVEFTKANRCSATKLYLSGIAFSAALAATFVGLAFLSEVNVRNEFIVGILFHLGAFNITLAAFQLLPILPLDGGHFLINLFSPNSRSRRVMVKVIYGLGVAVGLVLVTVGGAQVYEARPVLGAWLIVIGVMLLKANFDAVLSAPFVK